METENGMELNFGDQGIGMISTARVNKFIPGVSPEMPLNSTITVYGKRRSGKSVFHRWLELTYLRYHIPQFWTFTQTKHNLQFESYMPSKFIIPGFTENTLKMVMARQKVAIQEYLKHPLEVNPRACIIWDDYNGKNVRFNETLEQTYTQGRHSQLCNIYNAQFRTMTPPVIRTNTDYCVIFNTDSEINIKAFWEEFAAKMPYECFLQLFIECCQKVPYGFLCIDNDPNVDYDKKFYAGLAEVMPIGLEYLIGSQSAWKGAYKQLMKIGSGEMEKEIELLSLLSKPLEEKEEQKNVRRIDPSAEPMGVDGVGVGEPPAWDAHDLFDYFGIREDLSHGERSESVLTKQLKTRRGGRR